MSASSPSASWSPNPAPAGNACPVPAPLLGPAIAAAPLTAVGRGVPLVSRAPGGTRCGCCSAGGCCHCCCCSPCKLLPPVVKGLRCCPATMRVAVEVELCWCGLLLLLGLVRQRAGGFNAERGSGCSFAGGAEPGAAAKPPSSLPLSSHIASSSSSAGCCRRRGCFCQPLLGFCCCCCCCCFFEALRLAPLPKRQPPPATTCSAAALPFVTSAKDPPRLVVADVVPGTAIALCLLLHALFVPSACAGGVVSCSQGGVTRSSSSSSCRYVESVQQAHRTPCYLP